MPSATTSVATPADRDALRRELLRLIVQREARRRRDQHKAPNK